MPTPDQKLAKIAERQHSVFTFDQALSCGFTPAVIRYRVKSGRWTQVHRGVYRLAGAATSYDGAVLAAVLAGRSGAVAFRRTAGALFQVEGIDRRAVEIVSKRQIRVRGVRAVQSRRLALEDLTRIGSIPVTTPQRTMIDLATVLRREPLEDALDDLIRRRLVDPRRLEQRLERIPRRGRRGSGLLLKIVRTRTTDNVPGSSRQNVLRRAITAAGLPEPVSEYSIYDDEGRFVARVDLAYPELKLYIEYDGGWHESPRRREADLERQNRLSALGWRPLRFTKRSSGVVELVSSSLPGDYLRQLKTKRKSPRNRGLFRNPCGAIRSPCRPCHPAASPDRRASSPASPR